MKGEDKLLTVVFDHVFASCEVRKCGIYDFETEAWMNIDGVLIHHGMKENYIGCSMVYDHLNRSNVYLLSNTGELASYHVFKDEWQNIYHDLDILYPLNKKPVLWLDHKNTNILYYAGLKETEMMPYGYNVNIYSFDLRSNDRKWNKCLTNWDDLKIYNCDYGSAQLMK